MSSAAAEVVPVVRSADEGTALWTMGQLMLVKASSDETGGEMAALDVRMTWEAAPPLHIHHHESEINIILEGEMTVRCGEETWECGPGSFVYLPKGVPHAFRPGPDGARMMAIVMPGGLETLYEKVGVPAGELRIPDLPPNIEGWMTHASAYGLELVGPPIPPRETGGDGRP
ncbi:MAG: cupin domain-containing protein [Candidatus Dormiibacterota bacterium]